MENVGVLKMVKDKKNLKIAGIVIVGLFLLGALLATTKPTVSPTQPAKTWDRVIFDIGEWDKNNGETTTQKFQITSDKWRIRWAKRGTTTMSIEVFDSNGKTYGSLPDQPFTFDFGEKEGTLDFEGKGTYYVHFIGGTNKTAGIWDITVEELK